MTKLSKDSVRWYLENEDGTDDNREIIVVSAEDARKEPPRDGRSREALQKPFTVTDLLTGKKARLRRAECGLDCLCALERWPVKRK